MDFVSDNIVWFIAGGLILIMTIVGYYAEKTDFGKNKDNDKKVKEKKTKKGKSKKEEITEPILKDESLDAAIPTTTPDAIVEENKPIEDVVISEDIIPFDDVTISDSIIQSDNVNINEIVGENDLITDENRDITVSDVIEDPLTSIDQTIGSEIVDDTSIIEDPNKEEIISELPVADDLSTIDDIIENTIPDSPVEESPIDFKDISDDVVENIGINEVVNKNSEEIIVDDILPVEEVQSEIIENIPESNELSIDENLDISNVEKVDNEISTELPETDIEDIITPAEETTITEVEPAIEDINLDDSIVTEEPKVEDVSDSNEEQVEETEEIVNKENENNLEMVEEAPILASEEITETEVTTEPMVEESNLNNYDVEIEDLAIDKIIQNAIPVIDSDQLEIPQAESEIEEDQVVVIEDNEKEESNTSSHTLSAIEELNHSVEVAALEDIDKENKAIEEQIFEGSDEPIEEETIVPESTINVEEVASDVESEKSEEINLDFNDELISKEDTTKEVEELKEAKSDDQELGDEIAVKLDTEVVLPEEPKVEDIKIDETNVIQEKDEEVLVNETVEETPIEEIKFDDILPANEELVEKVVEENPIALETSIPESTMNVEEVKTEEVFPVGNAIQENVSEDIIAKTEVEEKPEINIPDEIVEPEEHTIIPSTEEISELPDDVIFNEVNNDALEEVINKVEEPEEMGLPEIEASDLPVKTEEEIKITGEDTGIIPEVSTEDIKKNSSKEDKKKKKEKKEKKLFSFFGKKKEKKENKVELPTEEIKIEDVFPAEEETKAVEVKTEEPKVEDVKIEETKIEETPKKSEEKEVVKDEIIQTNHDEESDDEEEIWKF